MCAVYVCFAIDVYVYCVAPAVYPHRGMHIRVSILGPDICSPSTTRDEENLIIGHFILVSINCPILSLVTDNTELCICGGTTSVNDKIYDYYYSGTPTSIHALDERIDHAGVI